MPRQSSYSSVMVNERLSVLQQHCRSAGGRTLIETKILPASRQDLIDLARLPTHILV